MVDYTGVLKLHKCSGVGGTVPDNTLDFLATFAPSRFNGAAFASLRLRGNKKQLELKSLLHFSAKSVV